MNKKDIPEELKQQLDQFEVEVPEIPLKKSLSQRIANLVHTPAKNPADMLQKTATPLTIACIPVGAVLILSLPLYFIY
ncbi:hypothetical protein [Gracilibacillus massiliensis]|uniref:hypothetical protein n=1 Tax=Gracilibacillus massiliensis TaxID=1564956 RepID=UPI00071DEC94|nr:hypothetical protein [Gracilibacillus massiliensis]